MGRRKIVFDDKQFSSVEYMAMIHCTGEEIAGVMGVDYDTLNRIIKDKYKMSIPEFLKAKGSNGKMSLRRAQWKTAEAGNVSMLIWLGKQWLNQNDRQEITTANIDENTRNELSSLVEKFNKFSNSNEGTDS